MIETQSTAPPELEPAALLGELARPLLHECNNFLNNLFLEFALAQEMDPGSLRPDMAAVMQHGKRLAALADQWRQSRRNEPRPTESVRLDLALQEVVQVIGRARVQASRAISLDLGPEPLAVGGSPGEIKRLCYFLISNALGISAGHEPSHVAVVHALKSPAGIVLQVDDNRTDVTDDELSEWFTISEQTQLSRRPLELAACASLAQRLHAGIHAERGDLGGVRVVVAFGGAKAA